MKIGLLVIATGKYIEFAQPLWDSVKKYFLTGSKYEVKMFVFTDNKTVPKGATRFFQKHHKFPYPTLMRYRIFLKHRKTLAKMDYLFYCDADMKFVAPVGSEILGNLVATLHPGFYNKPRSEFSYETRKSSTAYVSPGEGRHYFCGGFNGGKAKPYLRMAVVISRSITKDLKKGIVAVWHDESHLNRYFIDHPPKVILPPSYCYPEGSQLPFKPKLVALNKNHGALRYSWLEAKFYQTKTRILGELYNLVTLARAKTGQLKFKDTVHFDRDDNSQDSSAIDLVTIAFNNPTVIEMQIKFLQKNLSDKYIHLVADNSSDPGKSAEILNICRKYDVSYVRSVANAGLNPSHSHGAAINWICKNYLRDRETAYFGFLDHDIFPIKRTSIIKHLKKNPVYGWLQERGDKWYLWAGFCFFRKSGLPSSELNFLPGHGLDTGGGNWGKIYTFLDKDKLEEILHWYADIGKPKNSIVSAQEISQLLQSDQLVEYFGDWLHTFNASNWRQKRDKNQLVEKLLEKFDGK